MSKIRTLSAGVLCAAGLSLAGILAGPAVASAAPGQPMTPAMGPGTSQMHPEPPPTHPVYHYTEDVTHPVWSVTHPFWALMP